MDVVDPRDHGSRIKNLQSSSGTARDDDYHDFTMIIKSHDVDDGHDEFYQLPNEKTLEHPTDHLHQPRHPNLPPHPHRFPVHRVWLHLRWIFPRPGGAKAQGERHLEEINPIPIPTVWMVLKLLVSSWDVNYQPSPQLVSEFTGFLVAIKNISQFHV